LKKVAFKKDGVEFELHNSLEALRDLGRYHKLFTERMCSSTAGAKQAEDAGFDPDDLKKQVAALDSLSDRALEKLVAEVLREQAQEHGAAYGLCSARRCA
jgi:hypothetical protein